MNFTRRIKLKKIKNFLSFLTLWDITTDICYVTSRPMINDFLWKVGVCSIALNIFGPAIILLFGHVFNTFIHVCIFKVQKFDIKAFWDEAVSMCKLSHAFVFKTLLDEDIQKKKAIYRTSFTIHIIFESFPQLVLQSTNNQMLKLWYEPFGIISALTSASMILATLLIIIKTDKYFL